MAPRQAVSSTPRRWLLAVIVAVLAIVAIVLALLAMDRVQAKPPAGDVAPAPTFTQPAPQSASPNPTPTSSADAAAPFDRSQERFLTVSSTTLWRGVAGECGAVDPSLERSTDGGLTWTDVTPSYLGIGQLVALYPFADGQAEIVALMGDSCELQALRTFTQGEFWESYPEALAASLYVDPADAASIVRADAPVAAPCADAHSLRSAGSAIASVCDGSAFVLDQDAEWRALPATEVAALNGDADDVLVAHASDACSGVAVTRYVAGDADSAQDAGCADAADVAAPTAISVSGEDVLVWSNEEFTVLSQ